MPTLDSGLRPALNPTLRLPCGPTHPVGRPNLDAIALMRDMVGITLVVHCGPTREGLGEFLAKD